MAKQVDDLTLRVLKDIQASLSEHSKRFDRLDQRFDGLERRLDEINDGMVAALGLASHAHVREDSMKKEIDDLKKRVKRLEAKA
jgi:septal ring factor EnvC (AmiA/AmiB activator)